ncbi:MAG: S1C family serine protease [Opitutales bacterium]
MLAVWISALAFASYSTLFAQSEADTADAASDQTSTEAAAENSASLSSEQMNALCIIEGNNGVGSGFFCNLRGVPFVVTNIHVLAGNDRFKVLTLDGTEVRPTAIAIARDHDVALIRVEAAQVPGTLELLDNLSQEVSIGDPVLVPGNESGAGVITQTEGKVRGLGPRRVEVDAKFVPGNSGSPVLHLPTGKVIGVATYLVTYHTDELRKRADKTETRWFGFRVDSVKEWEGVAWERFRREAQDFAAIEDTTDALYELLRTGRVPSGNPGLEHAFRMAQQDLSRADSRSEILDTLETLNLRINSVATADLTSFRKARPYDFFGDQVELHARYRKAVVDYIEDYDEVLRDLERRR